MSSKRGFVGDVYWHVHHQSLLEVLTEPIANRIAYIKSDKPEAEVPIRLRWMTPVLGELPAPVVKARDASDKALDASFKGWDAYNKAWDAYKKAWQKHKPALEALHAQEHPGCPWDGRTIFPEVVK